MLTNTEMERRYLETTSVPAGNKVRSANAIDAATRARRLRRERRMSESTRTGATGWSIGLW